jgi:hypothetical protein
MYRERRWQKTRRAPGRSVFPELYVAAALEDQDLGTWPGSRYRSLVLLVHQPDTRLIIEMSGSGVPEVRVWPDKIAKVWRAPRHTPTSSSWRTAASLRASLHSLQYLVGGVEALGGGAAYLLDELLGSAAGLGARGNFLPGDWGSSRQAGTARGC